MRYRTCCYFIVCLIVMAISGLSSFTICGQSWNRGDIGDSGCSAYFPFAPEWTVEFSDDSSLVWTGEVTDGDIHYGVICVEFAEDLFDLAPEELVDLTENYLNYLEEQFSIVTHSGYTVDYDIDFNEYAIGVSDSWVDSDGDPWEIMTYTDEFNLAVMFMYGPADSFTTENRDFFFNSFRFPE